MNRLTVAPAVASRPQPTHEASPWRVERHVGGAPKPARVATFAPVNYEPGYRYPLLVWLHGAGSDERELPSVMRHVSLQNCVAIAPRGSATPGGHSWRQSERGIEHAVDAVAESVLEAQERFSIHPERVFLAGVGAGGSMALRVALRRPTEFAGAASVDGALPRGRRPLCCLNEARGVPLLLCGAQQSAGYTEARLCRDLTLLHTAGFRIDVRQYPGSDALTTEMLADLNRWLMGIVCGESRAQA